ncbi:hypothetical protein CRG98_028908 [Punica granatum]|uniref:Uncharacterized protein n=1 Tax=Punica granatum TaxID=22663 RepID=A0A2I0J4W5_PUNGR|nr:hypothetical protein CRG98_028908 [Punica granatum]
MQWRSCFIRQLPVPPDSVLISLSLSRAHSLPVNIHGFSERLQLLLLRFLLHCLSDPLVPRSSRLLAEHIPPTSHQRRLQPPVRPGGDSPRPLTLVLDLSSPQLWTSHDDESTESLTQARAQTLIAVVLLDAAPVACSGDFVCFSESNSIRPGNVPTINSSPLLSIILVQSTILLDDALWCSNW